MTINQK